jgi:hypothetical protein
VSAEELRGVLGSVLDDGLLEIAVRSKSGQGTVSVWPADADGASWEFGSTAYAFWIIRPDFVWFAEKWMHDEGGVARCRRSAGVVAGSLQAGSLRVGEMRDLKELDLSRVCSGCLPG